ncbi:Polysaccharide biosynthesis protein [Chitinophaga eiseniae]|uniref:Polysaccharide biosynthesis protein n=1 Tax=Chitinophaga eiseniae TaxID=634771 RepID=A0A1T4RXX6_9BACT|nr:SDR family NAD(P)-dependent oxidoreductase [Chitinophaga eiseniae]SKA20441.1 Polysaccharide biosynthesis protein [Chitinophaga eiseniae]
MDRIINLSAFIGRILHRNSSILTDDIIQNKQKLAKEIDGKNIMVIGGAGTIGGSFIKALLRNGTPAQLVVVDINENGLTEIIRDIRSSSDLNIPPNILTYPVNFSDPVFEKILRRYGRFDVVANFAAHKHVRSEKDELSIEAMVHNNVLKARDLLDKLLKEPPAHFFCVSTDKAANPVNIMGASKKLMEDVIMAYSEKIKITTARFANVAFSNGSLPFGFMERLQKRQPFSAPKDVRRFFVSPEESGEICMIACLLGASGDIFFPKLDEVNDMYTFTYVADELLKELGLKPVYCQSEEEARQMASKLNANSSEYPVYYFASDTSGEKPYEEFYTSSEVINLDAFGKLGIIKETPRKSLAELDGVIQRLEAVFQTQTTKAEIVHVLKDYLPDFQHIETGKSLDQKM